MDTNFDPFANRNHNANAWMVVGIIFIIIAVLLFWLAIYFHVQRRRSVDEIRRLSAQVISLQQQLPQNAQAYGFESKNGGFI